ncbi:MAG TPA: heparinase II/III-family protein, partial [Saprospiraceae bacterium]|nr:heparinase II/III-family protein [Saprospiraceae bacterium]
PLNESGYRKFVNEQFELFIDVGQIAPSYQPGHSHADNLHFLLNYKNQPIIVDTGISTYEKSDRRQSERSTLAHNTLTINEKDSSEVWGGFRVGRRARTRIILEEDKLVVANHDGYRKEGIIHQRSFNFSEKVIKIVDTVSGDLSNKKIKGYLHFNHNCTLKIEGSNILVNNELQIHIENPSELFQEEYELALGYNKIVPARRVCYIINQTPIKISIKQK